MAGRNLFAEQPQGRDLFAEQPQGRDLFAEKPIFQEELRALPETRDAFKIEIPEEEITKKRYELFTDSMLKDVYGEQGLKDIKTGQRRTEIFMSRAPKIAMAFASPLTAIAFETYDQAKTALVSAVKKEKYNPFELRMLSELLPKGTPSALKTAASVGETLSDIAIIGGAMNMATEGTLRGVLKEVGTKLEKAGYGKGRITISREAIKNAAKGTRLEDAAKQYLKAKNLKVSPLMEQIAEKGVVTPVPGAKAPLIAPTTPKTPIVGGVSKGLVPVKPIEPTKAPEVAPKKGIVAGDIVYHGTPTGELNYGSQAKGNQVPFGVHFTTDKSIAESFASGETKGKPLGGKGKIVEATVTAKNPLDITKGVYKEDSPEYKMLKEIADKSGLRGVERNFTDNIGFTATPMEGNIKAINPDEVMSGAKLSVVKSVLKENGYDLAIKYSMRGSKDPLGMGSPVYNEAIAILDKSLTQPTKAPEVAPEAPIAKPVISTPQARKEAISKPLGEGVERVPKLIQRIENKHIAELESKGITYNRLDIQKDAALAVDFVGKFPSRAKNISYNRETPPQGITGSSIREAYRHSVENNPVEYRKVIQAEALREVRLGQEIATLKEWRTASDPMNYIKDVMAQRLQKIAPLDITYKTTQAKAKTQQAGELVIRQKVDTIKQSFTKDIKLQNAQEILKRIIC